MQNEHDETKLPKWAQTELSRLRADLRHFSARLYEMVSGGGESNVILPYFLSDLKDQALPKDTRVQFKLPYSRRPTDGGYVEVRHNQHGFIEIHGSHPIDVEPTSGNAINVKLRDF